MSDLRAIYAKLRLDLGTAADAASLTGSLHARLKSLMPLVEGTGQVAVVIPLQPAAPASFTNGNNAWGSWATLIAASILPACAITHVTFASESGNQNFLAQLGVGGAGAESAIWDHVENQSQQLAGDRKSIDLPRPIRVAANARLAVRGSENGASTAYAYATYLPTPY